MSRILVTVLADGTLAGLVCGLPILWLTFTLRTPGGLDPHHYSTLLLVAAIGGLLLGIPGVSIIAVTALLAFGLAWLSARYALTAIEYERSIVPPRLFPGDEADLVLRIDNRKILPLSWISIEEPVWTDLQRSRRKFDEMLKFSLPVKNAQHTGHILTTEGAVGPFGTFTVTVRVTGLQRGAYTIGPAKIASGDPFGFFRRQCAAGTMQDIVVYPRIYSPEELGVPMREALGEIVARRTLIEDPTLMAGSREYRPGDPLRRVHWKSTAARRVLHVRVADPSTTGQLMFILNLNTYQHVWEGLALERMEAAISVTGSLAIWALDKGFAVGLHSNGVVVGAESNNESPRIAPSAHPAQASRILEHLARLAFAGFFSPERILLDEALHLRSNTSIILVTPVMTRELVALSQSRNLAGRLSVVYCGRHAAPVIPGISVHLAIPPEVRHRAVS